MAAVHPDRRGVFEAARAGQVRLLYVAPERLLSGPFLQRLDEIPTARFVIDEAPGRVTSGTPFVPF
jgi:ATP-dependent DNA helicase RecQ